MAAPATKSKPAETMALRPWQAKVIIDLRLQDDREVTVVVDAWNESGKTTLCTYLKQHEGAIVLPATATSANALVHFAHGKVKDDDDDMKEYLFVIDACRSVNTDAAWSELSEALKTLKGGRLYDTRGNTCQRKRIRPPKILVLRHEFPPVESLTLDRWRLYFLDRRMNLHGVRPDDVPVIKAELAAAQEAGFYTWQSRRSYAANQPVNLEDIVFGVTATRAGFRAKFDARSRAMVKACRE